MQAWLTCCLIYFFNYYEVQSQHGVMSGLIMIRLEATVGGLLHEVDETRSHTAGLLHEDDVMRIDDG